MNLCTKFIDIVTQNIPDDSLTYMSSGIFVIVFVFEVSSCRILAVAQACIRTVFTCFSFCCRLKWSSNVKYFRQYRLDILQKSGRYSDISLILFLFIDIIGLYPSSEECCIKSSAGLTGKLLLLYFLLPLTINEYSIICR